ncbi:uncharacterized protein [Amphiura filiformis]|uniref:uncharacterized protein n=1 Tax=Amphiura filiformis TaxID=82378 RepID=UPI003B21734A
MATSNPLPLPTDGSPGLLNLNLTANFKSGHPSEFDRKQAKCKLELLNDNLAESLTRPHRFAIKNFIAILTFQLGDEFTATEILEELLEEDEHNTNALQDLAQIYNKYHRKDDSQRCVEKLKKELDKIGNGDDGDESRIGYARLLAGKALAWGFDLHPDTKGTHRLDTSIELYEKALKIAGDLIDVEEKNDWLYYLALDYTRLNNIKKMKEEESYRNTFEKALQCIVPNNNSKDGQRKSGSWCLLGNLFSQRPQNFATTIPVIVNEFDLQRYWKNPELCFLKALEFNDRNVIARNRLAKLYYNDQKEKEALDQLNMSLQINSGPSNHDAYRCRARINRVKFNKQLRLKSQPDKNLLRQAVDDLNMCIKSNPYVVDMIHLAEVHHKLSWKDGEDHESKGLFKALHWCTKAETCQDGALRPELHQRRALVLQDMGDHENALKCFMQAMDFENKGTKYNRNFLYMYSSMLKKFHTSKEKPNHLLQQLAYWFVEGMVKYENTNIKVSYFVKKYPQEMLKVIEVLANSEEMVQLKLAQNCLKAFRDIRVQCDAMLLGSLETATSNAIEECEKATPKSPSASKRVAKANLTLDTSPSKNTASSDAGSLSDPILLEGLSLDQKSHMTSQVEQEVGHCQVPETKEPDHGTSCSSTTEANTSSSDTSEAMHTHSQSAAGGTEVSSPSQLPPLSPDRTPLSKLLNTTNDEPCNTGATEQVPSQSCGIPAAQTRPSSTAQSPGASSSFPQSTSSVTQMSKPASTPGSYRFGLTVESPDESSEQKVERAFAIREENITYYAVFDAVKRILDLTDLRLQEIGDPPDSPLHTDFKYDFYAIYDQECKKTRDFVFYHLRSQLEEGKLPLKGCIQERDFIVGKEIIENMANAIRHSARVIILISSGFFSNGWCKQAQRLAFLPKHCDKVFPIQLEDVVLPEQYDAIHCVDARKTINWGVIRKQLEPPGLPTPPCQTHTPQHFTEKC